MSRIHESLRKTRGTIQFVGLLTLIGASVFLIGASLLFKVLG